MPAGLYLCTTIATEALDRPALLPPQAVIANINPSLNVFLTLTLTPDLGPDPK